MTQHAGAEREPAIIAVHAVLRRGDQVLLGLRQGTGWSDGHWHLPSGHVERESSLAALVRETWEELGVIVDPAATRLVHVLHFWGAPSRLNLFFEVGAWDGEPVNAEPDKCAAVGWFDLDRLPPMTVAYAAQGLARYRQGIAYSDFGFAPERVR
ncbi:8-oxo-dGTP pyrophosphatase MutT (NUDIX family) [Hamadaea flava]|uniref:NUDIX domain-containing protein n=1 Tax=Hamadaea flava TaxID=1742688 RepID=A0ABV8LRF4_9ACTN|nr:NUDIX domain-containing protein [Hamadaea flava]MCP2321898.1 8-oxo-dGTP pyrophosphatase MutT (NUDIX family) [Hamadaea flava]